MAATPKGWKATTATSSPNFTIRGEASLPANSIIPVIVVPGIMGTNLRAKTKPRTKGEENQAVAPGQEAWRPPNWMVTGLFDSFAWDYLTPKERQQLLDPDTLEVDDRGAVHSPHGPQREHVDPREMQYGRQRWWGEVHADSYAALLCTLQTRLNRAFYRGWDDKRCIHEHWKEVMACDPKKWGVREMEPLTEADLEKNAKHHFPVYACGYNWLESCEKSSHRLEQRIMQIIDHWRSLNRRCDKVILVTHSMGGLVARACAKRIPDKIAGVIHSVMPAWGAPAAYRRMACGTEATGSVWTPKGFAHSRAAKILGETTYHTTPVLATSPGALELLPNHRYPKRWLQVSVLHPSYPRVSTSERPLECLQLPNEVQPNPYVLYRDMKSWYRLVDPALADPAGKYKDKNLSVTEAINDAIGIAEQFHTKYLDDYYHPNTYAFYGADPDQLSFGKVHWVGQKETGLSTVLTPGNINKAKPSVSYAEGARLVDVDVYCSVMFKPELGDTRGDGTVPYQSGAGPTDKVKQVFETRGYSHQTAYNDRDMLKLTLRLIVKIAQEVTTS
jgi:pimeloyl-ACP methyl ester carboxylesterase